MPYLKNHSAKCPICKSKVEVYISPCTDEECCGIDHTIKCMDGDFGKGCPKHTLCETLDYENLEDAFISFGGLKKELK